MSCHSHAPDKMKTLMVAEIAERAGVSPATIRFYARTGLIHPGRTPDNGYRYFSRNDLRRVRFIKRAQELGLTIADIKIIFRDIDTGHPPCEQVQMLVERRLESIRSSIKELRATERRIGRALASWRKLDDVDLPEARFCRLIESGWDKKEVRSTSSSTRA